MTAFLKTTVLGTKSAIDKVENYLNTIKICTKLPKLPLNLTKILIIAAITFISGIVANLILLAIMIPIIVIAINSRDDLDKAIDDKKLSLDLVKSITQKDFIFYGALFLSLTSPVLGLACVIVIGVKNGIWDQREHFKAHLSSAGAQCGAEIGQEETPGSASSTPSGGKYSDDYYAKRPEMDTSIRLDHDQATKIHYQKQETLNKRMAMLTTAGRQPVY
jgi:hypothetical protein